MLQEQQLGSEKFGLSFVVSLFVLLYKWTITILLTRIVNHPLLVGSWQLMDNIAYWQKLHNVANNRAHVLCVCLCARRCVVCVGVSVSCLLCFDSLSLLSSCPFHFLLPRPFYQGVIEPSYSAFYNKFYQIILKFQIWIKLLGRAN